MATWPSISTPAYGSGWKLYMPQIETEMEANYIQVRPRGTRAIYYLPLHWNAMTHAHLLLLQEFRISNSGASFDFPDPFSGTTKVCCFVGNDIPAQPVNRDADGLVYEVDCMVRTI